MGASGEVQTKLCTVCGEDLAHRPRTKDARGRYYCKPCYEAAVARSRGVSGGAAAARREAAASAPTSDAESDLLTELAAAESSAAAAGTAALKACPTCRAGLPSDAVLCTSCGYDFRTRRKLQTKMDAAAGGGAAGRGSAAIAARGAGLPKWLIGPAPIILIGIGVMGALLAVALAGAPRTALLAAGALALCVIGIHLWVLVAAFCERFLTGILTLFVPFYGLYFVFARSGSPYLKAFYGTSVLLFLILRFTGMGDSIRAPNSSGSTSSVRSATPQAASLAQARREFKTQLVREIKTGEPVEKPPAGGPFSLVQYNSPVGKLAAYLTNDPRDGRRHPAIVWITGGDCNSIGDVWTLDPPEDDQTAAAYRKAGIVMMFPSMRGGNDNPGVQESFLGEVDDVLAAAEFLANQPYVDPNRIYLGGHSTGGTMVLLVAECSDRFRAVFSFGPAAAASQYAMVLDLAFDPRNESEASVRAPILWLESIKKPTFVFEGEDMPGNIDGLRMLADAASASSPVKCISVPEANHFSILAPINELIAAKILRDSGTVCNVTFTVEELAKAVK